MGTARAILEKLVNLSPLSLLGILSLLLIFYLSALAVYRLYLSPLAKLPGPKLAALSKWYELYYEVVKRGQFTFHIDELHDKYGRLIQCHIVIQLTLVPGPIVRVTPEEIHIKDSAHWDVLFSHPRADKYAFNSGRMGNDRSVFTTAPHETHRIRRGALNPFFSKRAVGEFEWFVCEQVNYLCARIAQYKEDDRVLPIDRVFNAFTGDVITQYSFGISYHHLHSPDFKDTFHDALLAVTEFGHIAIQFPWLHPLLNTLPDSWNQAMNPALEKCLQLHRDLQHKILRLKQDGPYADAKSNQVTMFHEMLQSDLSEEEKSVNRLGDEALNVVGAGLTTTAWALCNAAFYIIHNPKIQATLQAELRVAFPDPKDMSFAQLEKMQYLRGCIREGIRFSHGVSARNPRVMHTVTTYKSWDIPAGVPVSMSARDVHFDERIYADPDDFKPERWMDNPRALDGRPLNHYFVAFGKGSRACLGINLAYMEMYLALGMLFRRFSFELHDTDASDVELAHDFFLPCPKLDSGGIRVKVTRVETKFETSCVQ